MRNYIAASEIQDYLREGYIYIDVRSPEEFYEAHAEPAINIPFFLAGSLPSSQVTTDVPSGSINLKSETESPEQKSGAESFSARIVRYYPKDAKLLLGCKSGIRSEQAQNELIQAGFTRTVHIVGGFDGKRDAFGRVIAPGWKQLGYPCIRGD